MIVSYFKCSLSTGAAVLTAKHQKGLYTKNCLLLQLKYVWRQDTQGTHLCYKIVKLVCTVTYNVGHFLNQPFSGQEMTIFESTMTPWAATARLLWKQHSCASLTRSVRRGGIEVFPEEQKIIYY